MLEKFSEIVFWLFFNVILALLPLLINFIIILFISQQLPPNWKWSNLLKEGQLFFFSTTLSAIGIGDIFLSYNKDKSEELKLILTLTLILLMLVLLLSSIIFGSSTLIKIQNEILGINSSFDENKFVYGSIACASMAIILSLVAFISIRSLN